MDTVKIKRASTKIIAHRGLSGIERENTCAAFVAAGNRDYFGIETDVHKTSDSKFVVFHDDNTKRISPFNYVIEETDYQILRDIHLYDKNNSLRVDMKIPSLEEYLRICERYEKIAVLELKNTFEKNEISNIIEIVKQNTSLDKMIFISFNYQNLVYLKELEPTAIIQFLWNNEVDAELINLLLAYNFDLDIQYKFLTKENIKTLHNNGIKINCWTVDNKDDAEKLIELGVDFITTNILQ